MSNRMIPFPGTYHGDHDEATVMVPLARLALYAISGPLRGRQFAFEGGGFVIGRADTCTVPIPSKGVSRAHARIEFSNGTYWLIPETTVNGTRLNGVLVQAPCQLGDRDQIAIYDSTFVVSFREPNQDADLGELIGPPVGTPPYPAAETPYVPPQPAGYPPSMVTARPSMPPQAQPARRTWPLWMLAAGGLVGIVVGVVIATVKMIEPAAPGASAPAVAPVAQLPAPPAKAPVAATQPAQPAPAPAKPKLVGVLAVENTPIVAEERGTVIDVQPVGTAIERGAPLAHHRQYSAAFNQAYAKLVYLQRKFGNSPEHEDFIAEARQDYLAAKNRRQVRPIIASLGGTIARVAVKPGDELRDKQVVAELAVARITVPVAAVDGTGKKCTAELVGSRKQLTGMLLAVGSVERTLELDRVPADVSAGDVGEVRIHCSE